MTLFSQIAHEVSVLIATNMLCELPCQKKTCFVNSDSIITNILSHDVRGSAYSYVVSSPASIAPNGTFLSVVLVVVKYILGFMFMSPILKWGGIY